MKEILKKKLEARRKIIDSGCWLWMGARLRSGHGAFRFDYKFYYVHRASMYVYKDFDLESPKLICHIRSCPNAHCFNPDHLYVGDKGSNARDATALGKNPWTKHCW